MNLVVEGTDATLVLARSLMRELLGGTENPEFESDALALLKNTSVARREGNFEYVRQQVRAQHEIEQNQPVTVGARTA